MQGWKSREWKTRHQTAEVENAGVTSMENQNSRYLTLLQVIYNSQYKMLSYRRETALQGAL